MPKTTLSPRFLPAGVLLLALALRAWGLTWGLPSALHYFSYHPDESVVLETSSVTMNALAGRLLPHFYNYGSLQLYLVCFANTLAALCGLVDTVPKNFAAWYPEWAKMYLVGRILTVGMGVGTVWAVCATGECFWGRRAGLLAALTLALMPLHAQHSHFLTVDVPATFWGTLSLLWAARLQSGTPKPLRAALLAGLFAGLAAATKYNMALALLPVVAAAWMGTPAAPPAPKSGGAGGERVGISYSRKIGGGGAILAFALAFLAACPGALLEHAKFMADLRAEAVHVQNANDPTFRDTGNGFVYHVTRNLDAGLGLPLLLLALASIGYALYRRGRGDALLAAFALPYYVLISLAAVRYARYTIPLLPILALWVGRLLADGTRLTRPLGRRAAMTAGAGALAWTLIAALRLVGVMAGTDTRDDVLAFVKSNASASATFGFPAMPWFQTAPLSPYFPYYKRGAWRALTPPSDAARYVYAGQDWDLDLLKSANPDFVILSEYDYDDALRQHDTRAIAYLTYLEDDHSPHPYYEADFCPDGPGWTPEIGAGGVSMTARGLPHDMLYPSPAICVFSHKQIRLPHE
jgi:hypothetical protein